MHFSYSYIFLLHLLVLILKAHAQKHNSLVSTILVFGDSTADPGNNNHILTTIKSNFKPYGREFPNHVSTGRFTNGKLAYDFIAKHFGIKEYVPPYLDQSLSIEELKTGVSFASAGTGIDPLTAQHSNVIPLSKQVEYFKEYQEKIEAAIGKEQTKKLIKESLFIISIGSNDIIANYKLYPFPSENYTVSAYIDFLLQHAHNFLKELLDEGARKIAMAGLPPLGCLPIVITLNSNDVFSKRNCIDSFNSIARDYNSKLQNKLNDMQNSFANLGSRIAYLEAYKSTMDIIQDKKLYDFEFVNIGCCGTGLLEFGLACNPMSNICPNSSKYYWWDSVHPTEKAYDIISKTLFPTIDSIIKN
ncbi:GDSL esterase/lipase At5g45960-like isoform X1 [Solanum lycopersicum]|uniref:GDSL esterase/lipase At5g45960-like isoform X1 n=1 Tax=Solanum lycopersicum TaxID=4081 RepID=UPI000276BB98